MGFTYDLVNSPRIGYVRLLIPDTDPTRPIFSDDEINAFYRINASFFQSSMFFSGPGQGANLPSQPVSYLRVAALALDTLASSRARLASIKQVLDIKLDTSDAAKWLRDMADHYRSIEDDSGAFCVIEQVTTTFSLIDRYWSTVERQSGS